MKSVLIWTCIILRITIALWTRTFFQPDEYFQALEPAHHMVFGYGHLTWEWKTKLRSFLYPALNVPVYWFLRRTGTDYPNFVVLAPRVLHGTLAALADIFLACLVQKTLGQRYVFTALLLSTTSFFNSLSLSRSLSNSLETSLATMGYYYYPWNLSLPIRRQDLRACLIFAALACAIRVTDGIIWTYLFLRLLIALRSNKQLLVTFIEDALFIGVSSILAIFLADSWYYGEWTFTPANFLVVNLSGTARFYGSSPWHYYILQAFPILCTTAIPFVLHGAWTNRHSHALSTMLTAALWTIAIFSLTGHKEWRFIHPLLPLFLVTATKSLVDLSSKTERKKRRYHVLVLLTLPVSIYTTLFYCSAPISVMSYLRSLSHEELHGGIGFLMPCHSTPGHAYLHRQILSDRIWSLGCEPPSASQDIQTYQGQDDVFFLSPRKYLTERFPSRVDSEFPISPYPTSAPGIADPYFAPWKHEWPRFLVFFGALLDEAGVEQLLLDQGYEEVWRRGRTWEGDGYRRKGGVRVWRPTAMLAAHFLQYSLLVTCSLFLCDTFAFKPAWNGYSTPESTSKSPFRPFYTPPGAKSYPCSSKLLHYSGDWTRTPSPTSLGGTSCQMTGRGTSMSFTFVGTAVEWFGQTQPEGGKVLAYIDGKLIRTVDTRSDSPLFGQRVFWAYGLSPAKHTLRLVSSSEPPKTSDIEAVVVTNGLQSKARTATVSKRSTPWELLQEGTTGVAAMQLSAVSETHAIIIDKVEHNPLDIDGHPAWAALYEFATGAVTPLRIKSNSFCAGGSFLSNGTLINVGGNPVVSDHTSPADFGDTNGLQSIRLFEPCIPSSGKCRLYENSRIRMASSRWYATVLRLQDGSAMIIGGSKRGGWINNSTVNNPTIEYYPPKAIHGSRGLPIHLQFLVDTLNANLFPLACLLPDGKVFIAANRKAIIYDWENNETLELSLLPTRVTYPMSGTLFLLPLSPVDNYAPTVVICGGSSIDDNKPSWEISSQDEASPFCSRMTLTEEGIKEGWEIESMPEPRVMPDAVLLPTGQVVIVNGARSGISGYGNVQDRVGESNADNPVLTPVLYTPSAPPGHRFSMEGMPTSNIPRLYHSVATLTPPGSVMIAGSNPNLDRSEVRYGTEYRAEWLLPPYMKRLRPVVEEHKQKVLFDKETTWTVKGVALNDNNVRVVLMDLGFVTHAVHANSRSVLLKVSKVDGEKITFVGPPNKMIYPPGPGLIYIVVDEVPSVGKRVMVGDGNGPPVDEEAREYVLQHTDAVDEHGH